jgi:murein DD-endopeptidase MepM/ murein hydrolase activator NlpD
LAEENDASTPAPESESTNLTRRSARQTAAARPKTPRVARATRPAATVPAPSAPAPKKRRKPMRSVVILTMVAGLIATVALPAYGAWRAPAEAMTLQQSSAGDAQSLVVASDATAMTLNRGSYAATTADEIAKKQAEEAAAERARIALETSSKTAASVPVNISLTSPGSGEVRWPLLNFTKGRGLWDSGYHQGVDLLAPAMTPIYAAAAGVVSVSSESYYGYGVAIEIQHVIGGQNVATLYGHMTYGTRQVQSGDTVAAGQLIGFVGSTGSSTANHCHFEVHINGSVVDPWAWLETNAG